jgi:hypothetical protein
MTASRAAHEPPRAQRVERTEAVGTCAFKEGRSLVAGAATLFTAAGVEDVQPCAQDHIQCWVTRRCHTDGDRSTAEGSRPRGIEPSDTTLQILVT